MELISIIGLLTLPIVGYCVLWLLKQANEWYYCLGKKKLPPGDMGFPFIGNFLSFTRAFNSNDPESFMNNLFKRYGQGGMYKSHLLHSPFILISKPELSKAVLTDDKNFKFGYPRLPEIIGKRALFTLEGTEHMRLRKLVTGPINGNEALSMYIEYIENVVMTSLEDLATMNEPVELLTQFKLVAFKVVTNIFFGPLGFSFLQPLTKLFGELAKGNLALRINLPGFPYYSALQARKMMVKIVNDAVEDRKARNKGAEYNNKAKKTMLDLLLEIEDDDGKKMNNETIIDLLGSLIFTGHETTAIATVWLLFHLHEHPDILQKVKEEHEEVVLARPNTQKGLTMAEVKRMTYTDRVILESLRLTNVGIGVFRQAVNDIEINGYIIPKGWKILLMFRSIHLDPEIYPKPNAFDPSRWEQKNLKAGSYTPFGLGSRICPGNELAKLEIFIFLHCFVLHYKLERINPNSPVMYFPMPEPKDKFLMKITKL